MIKRQNQHVIAVLELCTYGKAYSVSLLKERSTYLISPELPLLVTHQRIMGISPATLNYAWDGVIRLGIHPLT
jgi:hypothetical protein